MNRVYKRDQEITEEIEREKERERKKDFAAFLTRYLFAANEPINIHHFELPCDSGAHAIE